MIQESYQIASSQPLKTVDRTADTHFCDLNGLRIGTPELVRWGVTPADAPRMASLIARAMTTNDPTSLAEEVGNWRKTFDKLHFIRA